MTSLGTIVIDEVVIPLASVALRGGALELMATMSIATYRSVESADGKPRGYAVFGGDGELVVRGRQMFEPVHPNASDELGDVASFTLMLRVNDKLSDSARR